MGRWLMGELRGGKKEKSRQTARPSASGDELYFSVAAEASRAGGPAPRTQAHASAMRRGCIFPSKKQALARLKRERKP